MKTINLYIFFLTVLILYCSYTVGILILFEGRAVYRVLWGLLTFLLFFCIYKKRKKIPLSGYVIYMVVAGGSFFSSKLFLPDIIVYFTLMSPILTFFMLEKDDLNKVLGGIDKIICVLVFLSFVVYLLVTIGEPISSSSLQNYNQYYFYNYFYIFIDKYNNGGRFSGFTIEPGYFSLLLVSLLLIKRFDFTKISTYIYFVALLFTLSLGGYVLGIIGYTLQKFLEQKNVQKSLFVFFIITSFITIISIIIFSYNNGNNIVVEKIFERLVFDEDLGVVGNNRENLIAEDIIDTYFYSDKVWFGIGAKELAQALDFEGVDISSWRIFILSNGAIYTIVFFLLSILFLLKTNKRIVLPFFVVYWLDFYQHGTLYSETLYFLLIFMILNLKTQEREDLNQQKINNTNEDENNCDVSTPIPLYS